VRVHPVPELEERSQVREEKLLLGIFANGIQDLGVDLNLELLPLLVGFVCLGLRVEDVSTLSALRALLLPVIPLPLEVFVVHLIGYFDRRNVQLSAGHDGEHLMHPAEGAAVDDVGSGHEKKAAGKGLQDDNALSLVSSGQNDNHSTRFQTSFEGAFMHFVGHMPSSVLLGLVLRRVVLSLLLDPHQPLAPILLPADGFHHELGPLLEKILGSDSLPLRGLPQFRPQGSGRGVDHELSGILRKGLLGLLGPSFRLPRSGLRWGLGLGLGHGFLVSGHFG